MSRRLSSTSRRQRNVLLAAACLCSLPSRVAICNAAEPAASVNIADKQTPDDAPPVVGVYYYPWYGVNNRPLDHDWDEGAAIVQTR